MVRRRPGELWIKDCAIKDCPQDGKRQHYHQLNPNSQAVKSIEMTIRRALDLLLVFDTEVIDDDLSTVPPSKWKKIYGDGWYNEPEVRNMMELYRRYQTKTFHQQVIDMAAMLPADVRARKEIKGGLTRIRKQLNS